MSRIVDTRTLWKARWPALVRLARWQGMRVRPGAETPERRYRLVNALIRKLDAEEAALCLHDWQPRPDRATRGQSRYRCALCGAWGHIDLKRGGPVREYRKIPPDLADGDLDAVPRSDIEQKHGARFFRSPEVARV